MPAIEAIDLVKHFDGIKAVDGLSFTVERGQVVGLLGPNGAGKTTTVRMLVGLIRPNRGRARLLDEPSGSGAPVLARVGALVEKPAFVPYLTGLQNLRVHWLAGGDSWPAPGLEVALHVANLGTAVDRKVKGYSQGMRQRLGIAQALLNRPELLILDEPTNGLDPAEVSRMRDAIGRLSEHGTTILVSSHILAEVEQVCTHAIVVDHGKVVAQGTVADLVGASQAVELEVDNRAKAILLLRRLPGVAHVGPSAKGGVFVELDGIPRHDVVAALVHAGIAVDAVVPRRRLEDAYLSLVEDRVS